MMGQNNPKDLRIVSKAASKMLLLTINERRNQYLDGPLELDVNPLESNGFRT